MDCREEPNVNSNGSSFYPTFSRPQSWHMPASANHHSFVSESMDKYSFREPSFTRHANSIELNSRNGSQPRHAWTSTAPTSNPEPASYPGDVLPSSCMTNSFWTPMDAHNSNHSAPNSNMDAFMDSTYMYLGSTGADASNPSNTSLNAYPALGFRDEKSAIAAIDLHDFEQEFNPFGNDGFASDEKNGILNIGHFPTSLQEPIDLSLPVFDRRRSSSSFGSSAGPFHESSDLSSASDFTPRSSLTLSSTGISPVEHSRCPSQEMVRSSSQSKASPSPRPAFRTNPYPMDIIRENQTPTDARSASPLRRPSPYRHSSVESCVSNVPAHPQSDPHTMHNNFLPSSNVKSTLQYAPFSSVPRFHQPIMPPSTFDRASRIETVPYMLPNGTFRTLQSNAIPRSHVHDNFCDHAASPDLFGPLTEDQLVPPLGDMKPDEVELTPHQQEVRFEGDLYTPRWVRGHGNKREGWCGICKPGRWLVLKNSAYWYDKSFSHGVSAASGQAFEGPRETRRMDGNADVWEGLCGSCSQWIALVSSKKKGTTWFRHAYKCHTHSKVKDAPKRRRESHHRQPSMPTLLAMSVNGPGNLLPGSSLNHNCIPSGRIENITPLRALTSKT